MNPKLTITGTLVLSFLVAVPSAFAQTASPSPTTGSPGCAAIVQAAANGMAARMAADNQTIKSPSSVTSLTCLGNFFDGVGLNLVTNLLNPATLLQSVEGEICNAVQSTWDSYLGRIQCGLTVTGFNYGFGGLGGGLSCPSLNFGGGGPPIATIGLGVGNGGSGNGLYISGNGIPPSGYTLPPMAPGSY